MGGHLYLVREQADLDFQQAGLDLWHGRKTIKVALSVTSTADSPPATPNKVIGG